MTNPPNATYDTAGLGFLAGDVVFAVGAAARGRGLEDVDRDALDQAIGFLTELAAWDDDEPRVSASTGRLRELASSRRHVIQAAQAGDAPSAQVKSILLNMSEKLRQLRTHPATGHDIEQYEDVLDFFEVLSQLSLSEVRKVTEGSQPAWMSSLPTGLH